MSAPEACTIAAGTICVLMTLDSAISAMQHNSVATAIDTMQHKHSLQWVQPRLDAECIA